tara:strand:+ start:622 stop:912 length:291 start_codon:yes stop_codon:yes gene_type:complete
MFEEKMRKTFSQNDIKKIVEEVSQNQVAEIKLFSGDGDDKKVVISPGFKLQEPSSGLVYTVLSIVKIDGDLYVKCQRGDGTIVRIPEKDLKSYKRL